MAQNLQAEKMQLSGIDEVTLDASLQEQGAKLVDLDAVATASIDLLTET